MDVLYILGKGSRWANHELRYSLRSLERHAKNVDRVFVVGTRPGFLSPKVHFVEAPDASTCNKEFNIAAKVLHACRNTDIGEEFFWMNDDYFFIRDVDITTYPNYWDCDLEEKCRRSNSGGYRASLLNTLRMLKARNATTVHYDLHCPIRIEKLRWLGMADVWKESRRRGSQGFVTKTTYCNLQGFPTGTHMQDCKLRNIKNGEAEIEERVRGRHVFSIADESVSRGVADYLFRLFPNLSTYEQ